MALRFHLIARAEPPDIIDLPWDTPLAEWRNPRLVQMAQGASRHVVRFVTDGDRVYALKEMPDREAVREFAALRQLAAEELPAVEAAGLVAGRETPAGDRLEPVLVTHYLDYSLPFGYLFGLEEHPGLAPRLIDAAVVLLARLHLEGFYWGDCSLGNLLFRRDAGALMAYLVDAETTLRYERPLPSALREADIVLATENVLGGLLDLEAAGLLGPGTDVLAAAGSIERRYRALWTELTGVHEIAPQGRHLIERHIRRVNELGFDVAEMVVEHDAPGAPLRIRPVLVEPGHHRRELVRRTGLDVQENQARRLLNDIAAFGTRLSRLEGKSIAEAVVAARWMTEVYEPVLSQVPDHLRGRLDPPELFHELLEHRYFLAEAAGHDVDNNRALRSYLESVLQFRPQEKVLLAGGSYAHA